MKFQHFSLLTFSVSLLVSLGCTQGTSIVYWTKPGANRAELQRDKEECQDLQRSVGTDEWRIHKCLEVKGWTQVPKVE